MKTETVVEELGADQWSDWETDLVGWALERAWKEYNTTKEGNVEGNKKVDPMFAAAFMTGLAVGKKLFIRRVNRYFGHTN